MNDYNWFTVCFGLSELFGIGLAALMGVWLSHHRGGFAGNSNPKKEFNWHPLLMTIGMILLYGNAILIYRAFRNIRKDILKVIHATIHLIILVCVVLGLKAAFDSHNLAVPKIPNMYSLHSWIGLAAVIIFACQWVAGFLFFVFPKMDAQSRALYMPVHIKFGREAFALACITALLGLTEKAIFSVPEYSKLPPEGWMINFMGVMILCYLLSVLYMVSFDKYKRQPLPEDEMLLTSHTLILVFVASFYEQETKSYFSSLKRYLNEGCE